MIRTVEHLCMVAPALSINLLNPLDVVQQGKAMVLVATKGQLRDASKDEMLVIRNGLHLDCLSHLICREKRRQR